jgi:hypothetical protein
VYAFVIVVPQPHISGGLQLSQIGINLLAQGNAVARSEQGLMEALDDAVGLRTLSLGPGMINILHGEIPLILMAIGTHTILRAPSGEDVAQRDRVFFEEGAQLSVEQIRSRAGRCPIVELRNSHLTLDINEGLLGDPTDALQRPDIQGILRPTLARTFARKCPLGFFLDFRLL